MFCTESPSQVSPAPAGNGLSHVRVCSITPPVPPQVTEHEEELVQSDHAPFTASKKLLKIFGNVITLV